MRDHLATYALIGVVAVLGVCLVFGAGIMVGRSTGPFLFRPPWFGPGIFTGAHGAVGTIQKLDGQTITLQRRSGTPQAVLVGPQTRIDRDRRQATVGDLHVGDQILVVGSPNAAGQIVAVFIRVLSPSGTLPGL